MTVLNDDGLVGRVLRVTPTTATVLLIVDTESVVGGRVGIDMKVGFLRGRGGLGDHGRLDLELVDQTDAPTKGDTVVTWGSHDGAPYVSGVPIGRVTAVYASLRESDAARGDPAVRRLRRPRPGRRRGAVRHPRATAASIEADGSLPSEVGARVAVARGWRAGPWSRWCSRSRCSRHLAVGRASSPNFCLLVVVAAALVRGPAFAATLGFFAGLLLDLAPPADHVAGRWALALVVVGYVAGLMRQDTRPSATTVVATVAAASFVGTSVYALSGLVLGDAVAGSGDLRPGDPGRPALGRAAHPARAARRDAAVHAGWSRASA